MHIQVVREVLMALGLRLASCVLMFKKSEQHRLEIQERVPGLDVIKVLSETRRPELEYSKLHRKDGTHHFPESCLKPACPG